MRTFILRIYELIMLRSCVKMGGGGVSCDGCQNQIDKH